jgi:hypothetical protein
MAEIDRLVLLAEDQLTRYSTDAHKIEKLRQKVNLSVSRVEQQRIKEELVAQMPDNFLGKLVENQRQAIALPFWGIAGLGLLLGISFQQPLDFIACAIAFPLAIQIQKWGWKLQAKRLVIDTLEDIESRMRSTAAETTIEK